MNILKRPMFYVAGICCITATLSLFSKLLAFVLLVSAIIVFFAFDYYKNYKYIFIVFTLILFLIGLGIQFIKIEKIDKLDGKTVTGEFLVTTDVVEYDKFNMITLKPVKNDVLPSNAKFLIFDYEKTPLKMGELVSANLRISSIDKDDEYRISDYSSGIYATANIKALKRVGYNAFYTVARNVRIYVNKTLSTQFDGDVAGLLCAITTGDKTQISENFSHNVKTTGISHVVVVSGMHLSIIMSAVYFVIDKLFYNKYIRFILSIIIILLIAVFCGFTMSVIRAGATFIIASFAPILNRESDSLNSLLAAVAFILIFDPFAIFNISFLLSAISTLAILWVVPFYSKWLFTHLKVSSKILQTIIQMFLCCLFANIFTLPISIKMFGYMSIVSPITNLCITYFVTLALVLNIVAIVLYAIPIINYLGEFCLIISSLCARVIVFIVNKIASLPVTVAVLPKSAFAVSIFVVAIIIALMYYLNAKSKKKEVFKCQ